MFNKTFHSNSNRSSLLSTALLTLFSIYRNDYLFRLNWNLTWFRFIVIVFDTPLPLLSPSPSKAKWNQLNERQPKKEKERRINRKRKLIILRVYFNIFLYVFVSSAFISFISFIFALSLSIQSFCKVEAIFKLFIFFKWRKQQ